MAQIAKKKKKKKKCPVMPDRPSSVGTNETSSLPTQRFREVSSLGFILKFVFT
jgi:hypothetical protein